MLRNCYRVIGMYFLAFIHQINNIKIYFETHGVQKQSSTCEMDVTFLCAFDELGS